MVHTTSLAITCFALVVVQAYRSVEAEGAENEAADGGVASLSAGLFGWAAQGRTDRVDDLLSRRADVTVEDDGGGTALHAAVRRGHPETIAHLLAASAAAGVNVMDHPDDEGLRPLHWAALHGHLEAVESLLIVGASVGEPADKYGQQPLHLAARAGFELPVAALLDFKAAVDSRDIEGCTPLHWAATLGHAAVAGLLLDRGAGVDAVDELGQSPLHWAARGHAPVVRLLLQRGASLDLRDKDGVAAVDWASGHSQVLRLLSPEEPYRRASSPKPWIRDLTGDS